MYFNSERRTEGVALRNSTASPVTAGQIRHLKRIKNGAATRIAHRVLATFRHQPLGLGNQQARTSPADASSGRTPQTQGIIAPPKLPQRWRAFFGSLLRKALAARLASSVAAHFCDNECARFLPQAHSSIFAENRLTSTPAHLIRPIPRKLRGRAADVSVGWTGAPSGSEPYSEPTCGGVGPVHRGWE
jgi:hypothetical protein